MKLGPRPTVMTLSHFFKSDNAWSNFIRLAAGVVHGDIRDTNIMVKTLKRCGFNVGSFLVVEGLIHVVKYRRCDIPSI